MPSTCIHMRIFCKKRSNSRPLKQQIGWRISHLNKNRSKNLTKIELFAGTIKVWQQSFIGFFSKYRTRRKSGLPHFTAYNVPTEKQIYCQSARLAFRVQEAKFLSFVIFSNISSFGVLRRISNPPKKVSNLKTSLILFENTGYFEIYPQNVLRCFQKKQKNCQLRHIFASCFNLFLQISSIVMAWRSCNLGVFPSSCAQRFFLLAVP